MVQATPHSQQQDLSFVVPTDIYPWTTSSPLTKCCIIKLLVGGRPTPPQPSSTVSRVEDAVVLGGAGRSSTSIVYVPIHHLKTSHGLDQYLLDNVTHDVSADYESTGGRSRFRDGIDDSW